MENGLHQDDVIPLVHSGSRAYGGSVPKKFTTETRTSFVEGTADAIEYAREHDKDREWAKAQPRLDRSATSCMRGT
jgi:hypothetical protein